ncbi:NUDIX domain-containing protein [Ornithinibacillus californiensis]|uniref:NUDIX domain-containing protein n=1 Tax=Ornithinibacillus californiensis TaxID=161536 RepID=UPI00069DB9E4|nr:NUDIX domain-containing protein [Ornithinibacillus californiensis]
MITNNNGRRFIDFIAIREAEMDQFYPIAGSFAVIKCQQKFLLCYNNWRKQWEIPAGSRENDETPMECAIRELFEETGQVVTDMKFMGLLKTEGMDNNLKYNPVYYGEIDKLMPFLENDETTKITLWDGYQDIGCMDEVDRRVFEYI